MLPAGSSDRKKISVVYQFVSQARMRTLCDELVHDGYAESGQVTDEGILLGNPDPWMCGEDDLKSMISSVMEGVNFEITFLS